MDVWGSHSLLRLPQLISCGVMQSPNYPAVYECRGGLLVIVAITEYTAVSILVCLFKSFSRVRTWEWACQGVRQVSVPLYHDDMMPGFSLEQSQILQTLCTECRLQPGGDVLGFLSHKYRISLRALSASVEILVIFLCYDPSIHMVNYIDQLSNMTF